MTCRHVLDVIDAGPFAENQEVCLDAVRAHAAGCPTCGPALVTSEVLARGLPSSLHHDPHAERVGILERGVFADTSKLEGRRRPGRELPQARGTLPPNLEGRRYMNVAIFWGRYDPATLKASEASQHGRTYLPTESAPTAIVSTPPRVVNVTEPDVNSEPVPVPTSLDQFVAGWTTTVDISQWVRAQTEHAAK